MATCNLCGSRLRTEEGTELPGIAFCEDCGDVDYFDNGPTGHGEECYSDADPGM